MPLNRSALLLDASPSAVAVARRWVAQVCHDLGRDDLIDTAELGVSELVTNAILHGAAPVDVRVRGTASHPRIEVFDASPKPPNLHRKPPDEYAPVLETYGRGLAIVAMSATTWGTSIEERGKVVWFEPATDISDTPAEGVIQDHAAHTRGPLEGTQLIELRNVPSQLMAAVLNHHNNLRRELRLLALAHHDDYPATRELAPLFSLFDDRICPRSLSEVIDRTAAAIEAGEQSVDLTLAALPDSEEHFLKFLAMLDRADVFCRSQHLLSLERSPEQRALSEWIFDEYRRQHAGEAPLPCPAHLHPAASLDA